MNSKKFTLIICSVVIAALATTWLVHRSEKITQKFASHLSNERYEVASRMLQSPCSIVESANGNLILIDQSGNPTTVTASKLPFKVGGGKQDSSSDFSMTALGKSSNGKLESPAVIIYLTVDGGKVRIDKVDS